MKRYILTGAPGSGKTAIIRRFELDGFPVVEESATDVIAAAQARGIAEPWTDPSFIDAIVTLQKHRQSQTPSLPGKIQFHDRSVVCAAALARYLGYPFSELLRSELDRIQREAIFEPRVFFIQNLGFITPTHARRITFEESLRFEKIHEDTYRSLGFELVQVQTAPLLDRVKIIKEVIRCLLARQRRNPFDYFPKNFAISSCKKFVVMASSNIFLRKDARIWRISQPKR